jgi:Holliday junction resolvase-like predicted endonuclease
MDLHKSSRHSKITGDFAEHLVLYWLSKYGFECAKVGHTGIDIIAKNPHTQELMGISVKSRSRNTGKEGRYVHVPNGHLDKIERACKAFNCTPYFAIVVDEGDKIYAFILPVSEFLQVSPKGQTSCGWKMTPKHIEQYRHNSKIVMFEFSHNTHRWWK